MYLAGELPQNNANSLCQMHNGCCRNMVQDRITLRGKLAACIARLQGNLVLSKALQTWIGQHATEVNVSWLIVKLTVRLYRLRPIYAILSRADE